MGHGKRLASALLLAAVLSVGAPARADQQFPEGLVSITFDDGWETQYHRGLPHLRAHGIKAVFYLTTRAIEERWQGFMDVDQVRALLAEGHAVESHTVTHPDLTSLDAEALDDELRLSQEYLQQTFGPETARHFAVPYGLYDDAVLEAVRRRYVSARTVLNGRNLPDADLHQLRSYDVYSRVPLEDVRTWLAEAQAERSWIILTFHELVWGEPVRDTELDVGRFEAILAEIRARGLRVVSIDEGVRLMDELSAPPTGEPPPPAPPPSRDAPGAPVACAACAAPDEAAVPPIPDGDRDEPDGGCAAADGAACAWLVLWLLRRRRARALALAMALALGSSAGCGEPEPTHEGSSSRPPDVRHARPPPNLDGMASPRPPQSAEPPAPPPDEAAEPPPTEDPAEPPSVRFVGRLDARDPAAPVAAWPGVRILARFEGTELAVRLDERALPWMQSGPSELDVLVDGALQPKLVTTPGARTYDLAANLAPGVHEVELYRRTEAQNGFTAFLGFELGEGRLLAPPPSVSRRIEVIGDSASSGFGIEGVGLGPDCPGHDWAARYQNFHRAWGARLGERLGAEVHGTVYSGKGVVRNVWREDGVTMPELFARANPLDPDSLVDPAATPADLVLVMLGGNDFMPGFPVDDGPLAVEDFATALADFLAALRAAYPGAVLVLVLSPTTPDTASDRRLVREPLRQGLMAARALRQERGDQGVHLVEPGRATADELLGCNGHGTPEFHDRLAAELETSARPLLGW